MPREKRQFENGELYHITLRRIADEVLFKDIGDYFRGIFGIYEFNNSNPVIIRKRREERRQFKNYMANIRGLTPAESAGVRPLSIKELDKRSKIVQVLSFVLMPNHLHLILRQIVDKGISLFMQKFGSGLAAYFFERYYGKMKKKGHFFQDRFNAVHIVNDRQLQVAFVYDWTNPIALIEPGWKEKGIKNPAKAKKFLEQYRWSSYLDCIGIKNFPSIIEAEKDFLMEVMGGAEGCRQAVNDWILQKGEIIKIAESFKRFSFD